MHISDITLSFTKIHWMLLKASCRNQNATLRNVMKSHLTFDKIKSTTKTQQRFTFQVKLLETILPSFVCVCFRCSSTDALVIHPMNLGGQTQHNVNENCACCYNYLDRRLLGGKASVPAYRESKVHQKTCQSNSILYFCHHFAVLYIICIIKYFNYFKLFSFEFSIKILSLCHQE